MKQPIQLDSKTHRQYRIAPDSAVRFASGQHVLHVRAAEVSAATSSFPVFATRSPSTGAWSLLAVAGLEPGSNVFVDGDTWAATYEPLSLKTYPLFLMQAGESTDNYVVGIDEKSDAVSKDSGEMLFDDNGNPSIFLSRITSLLQEAVEKDLQSRAFTDRLDELGLFKSINVNVHYADDNVQTIAGLHTIDEDALLTLSAEQLKELSDMGYLVQIHAMLISIFQLNSLIRRHNRIDGNKQVRQAKLELARDAASREAEF